MIYTVKNKTIYLTSKIDIVERLKYVFIWANCQRRQAYSTGVRISKQALVSLSQYINHILDQILRHRI